MEKCFTCGAGFSGTVKELIQLYKRENKNYYFYQLEPKGDVYLVSKNDFKKVFNDKFKTKQGKIRKSVNYAHVSEFKIK